jgi:hypothetical protein
MYEKFNRDRALVPPSRLFEVRYEDLVRDPIEKMRTLYDHLELGEFETALPKLETYFKAHAGYRPSTYRVPDEVREQIDRRWGKYVRRYGYCQPTRASAAG